MAGGFRLRADPNQFCSTRRKPPPPPLSESQRLAKIPPPSNCPCACKNPLEKIYSTPSHAF